MTYNGELGQYAIAISVSESSDMLVLGLSDQHLRDAMTEIARHMLALGAKLVYGGDLRQYGFSELLFELVARHRRDADQKDNQVGVTNYLAWPVHIVKPFSDLEKVAANLVGAAELVCLTLGGSPMSMEERQQLSQQQPTDIQWSVGLTALRQTMLTQTHARILLGGRVDQYKGTMPGIAEEALLSLQGNQPLYLMGGFGGCARDVAESLGLVAPWAASRSLWAGREAFTSFSPANLNNGLSLEQNMTLARTPHVDQAIILILQGLLKLAGEGGTA